MCPGASTAAKAPRSQPVSPAPITHLLSLAPQSPGGCPWATEFCLGAQSPSYPRVSWAPCPQWTAAPSAARLEETSEWSSFSPIMCSKPQMPLVTHWVCHLQGLWDAWPNLTFLWGAPGQELWPSQSWPGCPKCWEHPQPRVPCNSGECSELSSAWH